MNEHSVICKFISEHSNWEELLDGLGIRIRREGDLAIFNYGITCDFYNPVVQEARGIIIDLSCLEVVCWPFRKFGNHTEGYVDDIDWSSARVQEKVDGSIVKLWFDKNQNKWQFSTNKTIFAENAPIDGTLLRYQDVIVDALKTTKINYDILDKNNTYIFELISPKTRVVVKYEKSELVHLGTRSNLTGQEYEVDIGVRKPKSYPLSCIEDCINAAIALNRDGQNADDVENEGFVVVDKNWHRIKIKSPDYIMMHHLSTLKTMSKSECVQLLLYEREKLDRVFTICPEIEPTVKFYDYKITELLFDADKIADLSRCLYEEYSRDRKAVASVIAKHRLSSIGFKALSTECKGRDLVLAMPIEKMIKLIPDYQCEDITQLFLNSINQNQNN